MLWKPWKSEVSCVVLTCGAPCLYHCLYRWLSGISADSWSRPPTFPHGMCPLRWWLCQQNAHQWWSHGHVSVGHLWWESDGLKYCRDVTCTVLWLWKWLAMYMMSQQILTDQPRQCPSLPYQPLFHGRQAQYHRAPPLLMTALQHTSCEILGCPSWDAVQSLWRTQG